MKVTFRLNVRGFYFQLPVFGGCVQEPQTLPGEYDPPIAGEKKRNRRDVELHQQRVPIARVSFLFNYPNEKISFVDAFTWGSLKGLNYVLLEFLSDSSKLMKIGNPSRMK